MSSVRRLLRALWVLAVRRFRGEDRDQTMLALSEREHKLDLELMELDPAPARFEALEAAEALAHEPSTEQLRAREERHARERRDHALRLAMRRHIQEREEIQAEALARVAEAVRHQIQQSREAQRREHAEQAAQDRESERMAQIEAMRAHRETEYGF